MLRREFVKACSAIGLGLPLTSLLVGCGQRTLAFNFETNFSGRVLVIGAGAAGLTAGYALGRYGIEFEILEASSVIGGRVKRTTSLADFPIDLGGEWIHTDPSILADLIRDETVGEGVDVIRYSPDAISIWKEGVLRSRNWASAFYAEYKFKRTTWYGFFERYMLPTIGDRIRFDTVVSEIDYTGPGVSVHTAGGGVFQADKVLVTVPISILKQGRVRFSPSLGVERVQSFDAVEMPDILKVFIEFSEDFYPDLVLDGGLFEDGSNDKLFYDAAFRKETDRHVLGLFVVGEKATAYTSLSSEAEVIERVLAELDDMFGGQASQRYMGHVIQDWTKEPHIRGSYSHWSNERARETLGQPLGNTVYFAGEAFAEEWSTVHGASISAWNAVEEMLSSG
jgi:monoamine oxidase